MERFFRVLPLFIGNWSKDL